VNVTDDADTAALMDFAAKEFGQINIVVPCAGIIRDGLMLSPDKETARSRRPCPPRTSGPS
jgi:3-oxoacyl-[acyl-carrier protein] reductase